MRSARVRWARWLAVLLVLAGLAAQPLPRAHAEDPVSQLNRLQEKQKEIQAQKAQAKSVLETVLLEEEEAEVELEAIKTELALANAQLAVYTAQHDAARQELDRVEAELAETEKRFARKKELLAGRIRSIHEEGRVSYLSVLFGSASFGDFISRFDLLRAIVSRDAELFQAVRADKEKLTRQRSDADKHRADVAALEAKAMERRGVAELKKVEQQQAVEALEAQKQRAQAEIAAWEAKQEEVEAEIYAAQLAIKRAAGEFAPVYPLKHITITSDFGWREHPVYGGQSNHKGTDFAASCGESVTAIEDGEVTYTGWDDVYGYRVVIYHGDGLASWYGHNSKILVAKGDQIAQGQVIAKAGSTGLSTGCHVHLEIRLNNVPKNPMSYLP